MCQIKAELILILLEWQTDMVDDIIGIHILESKLDKREKEKNVAWIHKDSRAKVILLKAVKIYSNSNTNWFHVKESTLRTQSSD